MTPRSTDVRQRPRVAITHRPLDERATRHFTNLTEAVLVLGTFALLASVALDLTGPVRAATAVGVVIFMPGWTLCRVCRWHFSGFTILTSMATSVAIVSILGQVTVTRTDWSLETVGGALGCLCIVALGVLRMVRRADV